MKLEFLFDALFLLGLIGLAGGFGGLVGALLKTHAVNAFSDTSRGATDTDSERDNIYLRQFVLPCPLNPSKPKRLGFFGDFIVGAAAGLSLYVGLEGLLGVDLGEIKSPQDILRVVALGIISGYMGGQIMDEIALAVGKRLTTQQAKLRNQQEKHLIALRKMQEKAQAREQVSRLVRFAGHFGRRGQFAKARRLYEEALARDPDNLNTKIELVGIRQDQAERESGEERETLLNNIIKELSDIIKDNPKSGRAHYNRACATALRHGLEARDAVLNDLKLAIECDPFYLDLARTDKDFKVLKDDPEFDRILDLGIDPTS